MMDVPTTLYVVKLALALLMLILLLRSKAMDGLVIFSCIGFIAGIENGLPDELETWDELMHLSIDDVFRCLFSAAILLWFLGVGFLMVLSTVLKLDESSAKRR